eukprot:CAMPEP_0113319684 /NCGR_PEP_ID=MMETSP0010_2-20120614/13788_1 /TAXON_ID=216773 ORGANISM="Corethron hystrix, Strain 308" /NCGR_SAMPLE_ID=MMETSP0010_2 /ASSEMBLY_ACC=CAM_ASM_000155 /LENGTH=62 /DNA_ID=CAMNT_0000177303 /DNA_START=31 /DNA_END=219 /DNA_ORIENTATION=- /assembly_acc=CAM_ASM_000155
MAISATHHPPASWVKGNLSSSLSLSSPPDTDAFSPDAVLSDPPAIDAFSPDAVLSDPPDIDE